MHFSLSHVGKKNLAIAKRIIATHVQQFDDLSFWNALQEKLLEAMRLYNVGDAIYVKSLPEATDLANVFDLLGVKSYIQYVENTDTGLIEQYTVQVSAPQRRLQIEPER